MTETTTKRGFDVSTSANSVSKPTGAGTPAEALGETKRMCTSDDDANQCDDAECPTCGDSFSTVTGMRKHHAHKHGESLVESATCEWCGTEIDDHPSDRVYCSFECRSAERSENGLSARSRQVTLICEGCGDEFDVSRSDAEAGKKYCSNECYHNDSDAKWLECEWCGDGFRAHGKRADNRRFCSSGCYGDWMEAELPTEEHARYKPEGSDYVPLRYGPGWSEQKKEAVRERDDRQCVDCGLSGERHVEKYGPKLNVHHLVSPRTSTNPAVHNAKRNLVTLCVVCHQVRERSADTERPDLSEFDSNETYIV